MLECSITFLCSRHIRPTCTKRSRCVCILRYGDGNCSNTRQNQQYINYVLKYDVSILLLSVPPVTREWKDACMAKSPGQAQRENATRSMYNITKLLQVRGGAGMQPHSKRKSCSTRAVCDLTGDSTHRESVSMHNEEDAVGSKAMC